jgi:hypothetical protein
MRSLHIIGLSAIVTGLTLCAVGCKEGDFPRDGATEGGKTSAITTMPARTLDTLGIFQRVLNLENAIQSDPGEVSLRTQLLVTAFDSTCGCFYTVGKGVPNPDFPQAVQRESAKRAAGVTAKRWTLYLKLWVEGGTRPFGQPIAGDVVYSTVVYEKQDGDTLYQMVETPLGSVVVQGSAE